MKRKAHLPDKEEHLSKKAFVYPVDDVGEEKKDTGDDIWNLSDTEIILRHLQQLTGPLHAFAFIHQIYHQLNLNKSIVDQDVEILRKSKTYKLLHCRDWSEQFNRNNANNAFGHLILLRTKYYLLDIDKHFSQVSLSNNATAMIALTNFREWIAKSEIISATHHQLRFPETLLLGDVHPVNLNDSVASPKSLPALTEEEISFLVSSGYIRVRRDNSSNNGSEISYYVSHPKLGRLLNFVFWVENEVISKLKRMKFQEMPQSKLLAFLQQREKQSTPSAKDNVILTKDMWEFHKIELVGRGSLSCVSLPNERDVLVRLNMRTT